MVGERLKPLLLFALIAFVLLNYVAIKYSTPALGVLWVKKHEIYDVLSLDDPWDALLRALGLRWTRPTEPSTPADPPAREPLA